jgi:hypothetical protein
LVTANKKTGYRLAGGVEFIDKRTELFRYQALLIPLAAN